MAEDFEKLAKDAIAAVYAKDPLAPADQVAKAVAPLISRAGMASSDPHAPIVAVVKGAIGGVLLAGQSVPEAAIKTLEMLPNISLMTRSGPENLMSWVMEGVAEVMPLAGPAIQDEVRAKIEEKYMGASTLFDEQCLAAKARG